MVRTRAEANLALGLCSNASAVLRPQQHVVFKQKLPSHSLTWKSPNTAPIPRKRRDQLQSLSYKGPFLTKQQAKSFGLASLAQMPRSRDGDGFDDQRLQHFLVHIGEIRDVEATLTGGVLAKIIEQRLRVAEPSHAI